MGPWGLVGLCPGLGLTPPDLEGYQPVLLEHPDWHAWRSSGGAGGGPVPVCVATAALWGPARVAADVGAQSPENRAGVRGGAGSYHPGHSHPQRHCCSSPLTLSGTHPPRGASPAHRGQTTTARRSLSARALSLSPAACLPLCGHHPQCPDSVLSAPGVPQPRVLGFFFCSSLCGRQLCQTFPLPFPRCPGPVLPPQMPGCS